MKPVLITCYMQVLAISKNKSKRIEYTVRCKKCEYDGFQLARLQTENIGSGFKIDKNGFINRLRLKKID